MIKNLRANRQVPALVCWKCKGLVSLRLLTYANSGVVCGLCGELNPLTFLHHRTKGELETGYEIILNFGPDTHRSGGMMVHALHLDCKRILSRWQSVQDEPTLLKLMKYLGATPEQMEDYQCQRRQWGQGSVHMRLLPNKKNLLRMDYSLL